MKACFYVVRFNFYPERPIGVPHFEHHTTVRFGDLTDALKYAFNDREQRGGFDELNKANARYGGCEIRRGMNVTTSTEVAHFYFDGKIEYYNAKVQRVAERLMK